jgi:ADP-ribosyl-[dinitrogen reductase] hydrolase
VDCGADNAEWRAQVAALEVALRQNHSVEEFAARLGLEKGVTGYIFHTVPVAVYAWQRHFGDYRATLNAVLSCGGDTDTTGAIAGALAGASVGEKGIPVDWLQGVREWPRSLRVMRVLADRLAEAGETQMPRAPVTYFWPGLMVRNALFLLVVLLHGFRRLAPPY